MLGDVTINALLALKPSGDHSFEDLLRELLIELSGQPYHLAASGSQGGVDGVAATGSVGFEAKLYGGNKSPDLRSLLGEISQVSRHRRNLELWILATTASLKAQDRQELEEGALACGVAILPLAAKEHPQPFHPVAGLCALLPGRVCEILADRAWRQSAKESEISDQTIGEVHAELCSISSLSGFDQFRDSLRRAVRELPTWKVFVKRHNQSVKRTLQNEAMAKLKFGTSFVQEKAIRRTVETELEEWLVIARSSHEPHFGIVLGDRYEGKTWASFDWLVNKIDTLDLPVFIVGSAEGDSVDLDEILASAAERALGPLGRHARTVLARHRRWEAGRTPWCLLLLDGLNEYKDPGKVWLFHLVDAFAVNNTEMRPAVVLCTVRRNSWPELKADLCLPAGTTQRIFDVGSYDNREFQDALQRAGRTQEELIGLPETARALLRRRGSSSWCSKAHVSDSMRLTSTKTYWSGSTSATNCGASHTVRRCTGQKIATSRSCYTQRHK